MILKLFVNETNYLNDESSWKLHTIAVSHSIQILDVRSSKTINLKTQIHFLDECCKIRKY